MLSVFSLVDITPVGVPMYSKNLLATGAGVGSGLGCGVGSGCGGAGFGSGVEESTYLAVIKLTLIVMMNWPAVSVVVPLAL